MVEAVVLMQHMFLTLIHLGDAACHATLRDVACHASMWARVPLPLHRWVSGSQRTGGWKRHPAAVSELHARWIIPGISPTSFHRSRQPQSPRIHQKRLLVRQSPDVGYGRGRNTWWTTSKSAPVLLCSFWLGNVLCATTRSNFSSLISPDGSTPAALASLLFEPPEQQIIGKTQCFATFLPFRAPTSSFFWLFLFSDLLSSSLLSSVTLPTSAFPSVHIVGSLTSKLPSDIVFTSFGHRNHHYCHYC